VKKGPPRRGPRGRGPVGGVNRRPAGRAAQPSARWRRVLRVHGPEGGVGDRDRSGQRPADGDARRIRQPRPGRRQRAAARRRRCAIQDRLRRLANRRCARCSAWSPGHAAPLADQIILVLGVELLVTITAVTTATTATAAAASPTRVKRWRCSRSAARRAVSVRARLVSAFGGARVRRHTDKLVGKRSRGGDGEAGRGGVRCPVGEGATGGPRDPTRS